MKPLILLIGMLVTSVSLSAGPKALIEASVSFRELIDPLLPKELSELASREEKHLRLELDRLYRSEVLIGVLWHQARRSHGMKDKVEEYRQNSLTCLNVIEQSVPTVATALAKTKLSVPADPLKARSKILALHSDSISRRTVEREIPGRGNA